MRFWTAIAFAVLAAAPFEAALAHPIHMSFTEIREVKGANSLELSVRVYANDFSAAAARFARTRLGSDSLIDSGRGFAYLLANIRLAGKQGTPIVLVPCGVTRASDMLRFCIRASLSSRKGPIQISNSLMTDLFHDQVNVVQSIAGRRRVSRMFVRGDRWKAVP